MFPFESSQLHVLLIGIDRYSQVRLADGIYYPNLGGCVRDVSSIESLFRQRYGVPEARITKLLSPLVPDGSETLPTYANIVAAFKALKGQARRGDQVWIHYSGHGGRSRTMFPAVKGEKGLDESIVPCDIGENGPCYLRDVEISYLLKELAELGFVVTLTLDCCHSGGATRSSAEGHVRGISEIDDSPPKGSSAVDDIETIAAAVSAEFVSAARSVTVSGWSFRVPDDFVLIAACQADEVANEFAFDGAVRSGALTHWLVDALGEADRQWTYRTLYGRLVPKIHGKFANQTPQIEGDVNRRVLGFETKISVPAVAVERVDSAAGTIRLASGLASGLVKGAVFGVFKADESDFVDENKRLAVVEVVNLDATDCEAVAVEGTDLSLVGEGDLAVMLGMPYRLRGRVRLGADPRLAPIGDAIAAQPDAWIRIANDGETFDLEVEAEASGEIRILDSQGARIENLRPTVDISDPGAPVEIVKRLTHLTKFRNIRSIENPDPTSRLVGKITVELGVVDDRTGVFVPFGVPLRPIVAGEAIALQVTNGASQTVKVTILDLEPNWAISQLHPQTGTPFAILEPGPPLILPLSFALPNDYVEGVEVLKVFASIDSADYDWFRMDPLDRPVDPARSGRTRQPRTGLDSLFSAFGSEIADRKAVNLSTAGQKDWTVGSVDITLRRPTLAHVGDGGLSLLQTAFEISLAKEGRKPAATRSVNGIERPVLRRATDDPLIREISQISAAIVAGRILDSGQEPPSQQMLDAAQQRGVIDVAKYCASMAAGMAREWFDAKVRGDANDYVAYKDALTAKFGDCDPRYAAALTQFVELLKNHSEAPYRVPAVASDFVIEDRLGPDATIGVVADWATGEPEAIEVLRQVKAHDPSVAVHLGDIYYSGAEHEVRDYFLAPWLEVIAPVDGAPLSLVVPGNHDLYSGGKAFYDLLDSLALINRLGKSMASYFCLRNEHWQLIGLDTAVNDKLGGGPTKLNPTEADWLKDKIATRGKRKTILMSHHQLFSANDEWNGLSHNPELFQQVAPFIGEIDLWLWGHEHDLVIFDEFKGLRRGRCIGGSAFPVGVFEMPTVRRNPDVPYRKDVELAKGKSFYQHCYTMIELQNADAVVRYYEDRDGGRLLFEETI